MENNKNNSSLLIAAIIVAIGLIITGYFISLSVLKGRMGNKIVTVKGLAEKEVNADYVVWPIVIKNVGNDITVIEQKVQNDIKFVKQFLIEHGLTEKEFDITDYTVLDKLAKIYTDSTLPDQRYLFLVSFLIRTSNLEAVKSIINDQLQLIQKNIIVGSKNEYDSPGPFYEFTKFNEIKGDLLSEAISNARKSAQQFAIDSGAKIGNLKSANQGSFSITPADSYVNDDDRSEGRRAIRKKVRVVTTLEYFLE